MRYIERGITAILNSVPNSKATILLGIRQAGKSTLCNHLIEGYQVAVYSGDEPRDVEILSAAETKTELLKLIGTNEIIFIDEAQRIPSIGLLIKRLVDLKTNCRIMVTGSSSLELSGGIYESAAGRTDTTYLAPFSMQELVNHFSLPKVVQDLPDRLVYGTFPFVIDDPKRAKKNLMEFFNSIVFKDIFALSDVRRPRQFMDLVRIIARGVGSLSSYDSLARETGLSKVAVINYLTLLEECFIIKILPSYAKNLENELKKSKKIYFCDVGLRNAAIGDFTPFSSRTPEEQGVLLENFFIIERMKKTYLEDPYAEHYFWRTKNKEEVDFIEFVNGKGRAFETKLSKQKARIPGTFARAYPEMESQTVNRDNILSFLVDEI